MGRPIDLTGQRFGRLLVISQSENKQTNSGSRRCWVCQCDCGNMTLGTTLDLRKGDKKSCGCLYNEKIKANGIIHGLSDTRIYGIWKAMRKRCNNPHDSRYEAYGGRGISVCQEWNSSFISFYDWSIAHGYNDSLTIDRIDCNGNYTPDNCRWVDFKTQCNNRRSNRIFEYNGESHNINEWSEILSIPYRRLYYLLSRHNSIEYVINTIA